MKLPPSHTAWPGIPSGAHADTQGPGSGGSAGGGGPGDPDPALARRSIPSPRRSHRSAPALLAPRRDFPAGTREDRTGLAAGCK